MAPVAMARPQVEIVRLTRSPTLVMPACNHAVYDMRLWASNMNTVSPPTCERIVDSSFDLRSERGTLTA